MYYRIPAHAIERFRERHPDARKLDDGEARLVLMAELERGVVFGGQYGNDRLLLLPCGTVAVTSTTGNCIAVRTILTYAHAMANMQTQGVMRLRPAGVSRHRVRRAMARRYGRAA